MIHTMILSIPPQHTLTRNIPPPLPRSPHVFYSTAPAVPVRAKARPPGLVGGRPTGTTVLVGQHITMRSQHWVAYMRDRARVCTTGLWQAVVCR